MLHYRSRPHNGSDKILKGIYHHHYEAYSRGIVMVLLPRGAMFDGVMCFSLFICSTSLSLRANALLHTSQTYGFSPVGRLSTNLEITKISFGNYIFIV